VREEHNFDVVVLGSGLAGLAAALAAVETGLEPLVIEKSPLLGGGTTQSYGLIWVGQNHLQSRAGVSDTRDDVIRYLRFLGGNELSEEKMLTFVDEAPSALKFFEDCGIPFRITKGLTDHYFGKAPGSSREGRTIETELISGFELGEWRKRIFVPEEVPAYVTVEEQTAWGGVNRVANWDKELVATRRKNDLRGKGYGLISHFVKALIKRKVPIWADRTVEKLLMRDGVIFGVQLEGGATVRTNKGVVLATGGYDYNLELGRTLEGFPDVVPMTPTSLMGDGLTLATELGAVVRNIHNSLYIMLGYRLSPTHEGTSAASHRAGIVELLSPHTLLVNKLGKRFADESFFQNIVPRLRDFDVTRHEMVNVPCFLIFDQQYPEKFSFANRPAGSPVPETVPRAHSLSELARKLGIDANALASTVDRFNGFARAGKDLDYCRGEGAWRLMSSQGSALHENPSLGCVEKPPFYGVPLYPSIGNSTGLLANSHAQVIHQRGRPIPRLYASGVVAARTEMGAGYQAGLNLASAMTFSCLAIRHMAAH
jgi:3-oxosteroid 1-dehydrogenase